MSATVQQHSVPQKKASKAKKNKSASNLPSLDESNKFSPEFKKTKAESATLPLIEESKAQNNTRKTKNMLKNLSDSDTELSDSIELDQLQQDLFVNEELYTRLRQQKEKFYGEVENKLDELAASLDDKFKAISEEYNREMKQTINSLKMKVEKKFDSSMKPFEHQMITDRKSFSEKVIGQRESLLSVLFAKSDSIKTLYNIAIAIMTTLFLNLILFEYKKTGLLFDLDTWLWVFNRLDQVFNIWVRLFLYNLLVIPMVQLIDRYRPRKLIWISAYTFYLSYLYYYTTTVCIGAGLNFGSSMILMCECARMSMKIHSYLRNKLLYGSSIGLQHKSYIPPFTKDMAEKDLHIVPIKIEKFTKEIRKYLYFFFAPTLMYRDRYIKGPKTNYRMVFAHLLNFLLCIYYVFILFKTFMLEAFQKTGTEPGTSIEFILSIFNSCLPSTVCLFLAFFGLLHSWFNAFAELLRFPDRHFYEDWWNALEFGTYYRKWNIVVHEFLYYYVYLDIIRFSKGKLSRTLAQMSTFIISAVIHEIIIAVSLGFFYPILFIIFIGPGIILIRGTKNVKSKSLNILFWFLMFIGTALLLVLYSREYYARKEPIDVEKWGWWYYVAPRTLLIALNN